MKKGLFANVLLLIGALAVSASQLTVTNTAAGKLSALIGNEARNVDSLTVEGPMDLKDIRVAWDGSFNGQLKYLNIAKAEFKDNKIPEYALYVKTEQKGDKTFLNIDEIVLPENLEEIGAYAFSRTMLTKMPLPPTLKKLGEGAFMFCNLTYDKNRGDNFRLPEGIEEIPDFCFYGSVNCNEFHFPQSLKLIGERAFSNNIISRIELPPFLEEVGVKSFRDTGLEEVAFLGSCKNLGREAFQNCPFLEKLILPNNAEIIPTAFVGGTMIKTLEIPENVRIIDNSAFCINQYLQTVYFHEGTEEIKDYAFDMNNLSKLILPSTLQSIGKKPFYSSKIYCKATIPPRCENGDEWIPATTLYVPLGAKALYAEAEGWKNAKEIIELSADEFDMAGIGDVTAPESTVTVTTADGQAIIETAAESPTYFAIYSADGRLVTKGVAAPRAAVSLTPGIYIVKTANSATKIAL